MSNGFFKIIFCFFITLVSIVSGFTQDFPTLIGADSLDRGIHLMQNRDSSFIAVGYTKSFSKTQDAYIVAVSKKAEKKWEKAIDLGGEDFAWYITEAKSEEQKLILGFSENSTSKDEDIFLLRIDEKGSVLSKKIFAFADNQRAWSMEKLRDGNYLIIGQTVKKGSQDFDGLVIKTDENGNIIWKSVLKKGYYDRTFHAKETPSGEIYVTGISRKDSTSFSTPWLTLLDKGGREKFSRTYTHTYERVCHGVIFRNDNTLILYGYTKFDSSGINRPYFVNVNLKGDVLWEKVDNKAPHDLHVITGVETKSGYYFTGYTRETLSSKWDAIILGYDNNFNATYNKVYGAKETDQFYSIISTLSQQIAVVGHSFSYGKGGDLWFLEIPQLNKPK